MRLSIGANNAKKQKCRSQAEIYNRNERETQKWKAELVVLQSHCQKIKPHNGKIYSEDENILLIHAIVECLERMIEEKNAISWTYIDREISKTFHVRLSHIIWLQENFLDEGTISKREMIRRGCEVGSISNKSTKVI